MAVLEIRVLVFCGFLVMADEDELDDEMEGEEGEDLDGEGGEDSEKSGGTKKVLIIVAVFLLLVVGGFAGAPGVPVSGTAAFDATASEDCPR